MNRSLRRVFFFKAIQAKSIHLKGTVVSIKCSVDCSSENIYRECSWVVVVVVVVVFLLHHGFI